MTIDATIEAKAETVMELEMLFQEDQQLDIREAKLKAERANVAVRRRMAFQRAGVLVGQDVTGMNYDYAVRGFVPQKG